MRSNLRLRRIALAAISLALVAVCATTAGARVRVEFPEDSPGIPAYARFEHLGAIHTDTWAAIPFYRDPAYVPATFNMLHFFDEPGAYLAPSYVEGFGIMSDDYSVLYHAKLKGLPGMEVWFISTSDMYAAMADGVVTIGELEALPSLKKGVAETYNEVLHPFPYATNVHMTVESHGRVGDEKFKFHWVENWVYDPPNDPGIHVQKAIIEFK